MTERENQRGEISAKAVPRYAGEKKSLRCAAGSCTEWSGEIHTAGSAGAGLARCWKVLKPVEKKNKYSINTTSVQRGIKSAACDLWTNEQKVGKCTFTLNTGRLKYSAVCHQIRNHCYETVGSTTWHKCMNSPRQHCGHWYPASGLC